MGLILPLLQGMARQEGLYVPGAQRVGGKPNRPQRNNNPGDLEYHGWEGEYGGILSPHDPRFAYFPTRKLGFGAMAHLLGFPLYFGKPLSVAIPIWAPAGENEPNVYLQNVLLWTGLHPDILITSELLAVPLLTNFSLGGEIHAI